jgi:hypothetical protein
MTQRFDHTIRATVNELADEGQPVNLASAAVLEGRRMIVRQRLLSAAAAVAVLAALAVPFAVLSNRDGPLQPGAAPPVQSSAPTRLASTPVTVPAPVPSPATIGVGAVRLTDGWILAAASGTKGTWVYDVKQDRYQIVAFKYVRPSPLGGFAAVVDGTRVGLLNVPANTVHWVAGPANVVGGVDWSDDGTRLVYAASGDTPKTMRLAVIDIGTSKARVIGGSVPCGTDCAPVWLPGSREIALATPSPRLGMQAYEATTGKPTRMLKLPGAVPARHSWSPSGRYVATRSDTGTSVVVAASGTPVLTLADSADGVYWVADNRLLTVRSDGFALYDLTGAMLSLFPWPAGTVNDRYSTVLAPA